MSALLAAQEVFKIYQMGTNSVTALDNVSLDIHEGEFVAIQGTSGSGKSTLLNMLGGLDHPTKGDVYFASKPLGPFTKKEMARYRRFSVGMIFQNFNLIPTMTARENVSLALAFGGLRGQQRRARSSELLARVGLGDRLEHRPSELSGGEQQRVAIARALAMHPALLLLDEPTSALDPRRIHSLRTLLRTFVERGHTMLIISHSMNFLSGVADNILFMENGEVVEHGPTDQLLNSPKDARTKDFLEQAD